MGYLNSSLTLTGICLLFTLGLSGCGKEADSPGDDPSMAPRPNILLIVADVSVGLETC